VNARRPSAPERRRIADRLCAVASGLPSLHNIE